MQLLTRYFSGLVLHFLNGRFLEYLLFFHTRQKLRCRTSEIRSQTILNFEFRNSNFEMWTPCPMPSQIRNPTLCPLRSALCEGGWRTPRNHHPAVARWHTHLRGLATAIHEISGLGEYFLASMKRPVFPKRNCYNVFFYC